MPSTRRKALHASDGKLFHGVTLATTTADVSPRPTPRDRMETGVASADRTPRS